MPDNNFWTPRDGKFELKNGDKGTFNEYNGKWEGSIDPGLFSGSGRYENLEDLFRKLEQKNFEFYRDFYNDNGYLPFQAKRFNH